MEAKEITNLVLVPDAFADFEALEEILGTMKEHPGFIYMNRSNGVMSPQGPTGYKEVVEIHWKDMGQLMDWSEKMRAQVPQDLQKALTGVQILFYDYRKPAGE
jgi:hypothetical protein